MRRVYITLASIVSLILASLLVLIIYYYRLIIRTPFATRFVCIKGEKGPIGPEGPRGAPGADWVNIHGMAGHVVVTLELGHFLLDQKVVREHPMRD